MPEPLFLVDTNICIYLLDGRGEHAARRFQTRRRGEVVTSAIVRAEVMLGAKLREQVDRAEALFAQIEALPFDGRAADRYAGLPFSRGNLDRLIAAHALALGLTLVTNNERDFADIPDLRIENWTR
ncbi:type II toxin-antitoxin system VapC family toxin [Sphingomonas sp.]|uniref:type II toxin-antitoxin system VapC family toxin n=1 Tax=Sphingomonas sp. TaxID=28214 RepID=UPI003B004921